MNGYPHMQQPATWANAGQQPPSSAFPPALHAVPTFTIYESNPATFPPFGNAALPNHLPFPPGFIPHAPPLMPHSSRPRGTASVGTSTPLSRSTSSTSATTPPMFPPGLGAGHSTGELDRFAPVYIPKWLLAVNTAKPQQTLIPENSRKQNVFEYAAHIYPKSLLDEYEEWENRAATRTSTAGALQKLEGGSTVDVQYASVLTKLQVAEHQQRKQDLALAALYAVPLGIYKLPDDDEKPQNTTKKANEIILYQLTVPALREGYPMLDISDTVLLRQLVPEQHTWQGIEFVASVWAVKRAQATIILRCDALHSSRGSMIFNIQFRPQDRLFYAGHKGLGYLGHQLPKPTLLKTKDGDVLGGSLEERSLAQSWLFPTGSDYLSNMPEHNDPARIPSSMDWVDNNLNEEQRLAVQSICFARRRIPFLINGPPGTGKTKTLVEAVLQILKAYPDAHVLVCGASNPSSDTLAARLSPHLKPSQLLRLNDESRPFDEVRPSLLPWCHIREDRFGLPELGDLLKYRVIVTSVLDTSVLYAARITNTHLARLQNRIYGALHPKLDTATSFHFDYLLIDEAAQASEPEITPALSVVCPDVHTIMHRPEYAKRRLPQLVLCGDQQQLGPFISSEDARQHELDLSLLQRLFERPVYHDHPRARHNLPAARGGRLLPPPPRVQKDIDMDSFSDVYSDSGTSQEIEISPGPSNNIDILDMSAPFANLINNYRSHPGLLMVPSSLFYDDTLEPCASEAIQNTKLCKWPLLPNPDIPFLVWDIEDGQEEMFEEGASWYNVEEVKTVVDIVKGLITEGEEKGFGRVKPGEISIISPFREQVWRIRIALRSLGYGDVNVGRESDMQGAENRVVIISTVRTSHRFIADDLRKNRGLISQTKRFNVATTRAKELLIIIGHAETLYEDAYWKAMIQFATRRGCFKGKSPAKEGEAGPGGISRLEELFISKLKGGQSQDVLASSMARIAMSGE